MMANAGPPDMHRGVWRKTRHNVSGPSMHLSARKILLFLAVVFYIAAGSLHFLQTASYVRIVPPFVPWPRAMVYISGVAEIVGGIGLLLPRYRRRAAWWIVALLIAVFPANIYMAVRDVQPAANPIPEELLWARLPFQLVLAWWVLWCTAPEETDEEESGVGSGLMQ